MLAALGRRSVGITEVFGQLGHFTADTVRALADVRTWGRQLFPMMRRIGVDSLPITLFIAAFTGIVLSLLASYTVTAAVPLYFVGALVGKTTILELGPVLTGLALAGRVGANIAAELGTMRVTEQIDALSAMGADPIRYLVLPRFLATLLLTPILTIFSDGIGVLGGWLVSTQALGINSFFYWENTREILKTWDIWVGIIKSFFFGGLIGLISCYKGFTCGPGAEGVGRATTVAFVTTFISILVSNFFLAVLLRHIYNYFLSPGAIR